MGPQASEAESWRHELRATLALAWPLVMTNLAQSLINATDTLLLGWAGARVLAAGALGINLYMAFLVIGMGLVMAVSPVLAKEIGGRAHSVRDPRRSVRQAMWLAVAVCIPTWLLLWHSKAILVALGQDPELAAEAQRLIRALQWGMLPALLFIVLRSFIATLQKPLWSMIIVMGTIGFNALLNYGLIFGHFGLPHLGLVGAGIGSSIANTAMFAAMALVVVVHPTFRRYRLFGHFWRPDWPRLRHMLRIGLPIAITLGFEVGIFNTAVLLMGLIDAASIAGHVVALQIASLTFMVPLGLAQAATVRVGLAYGRRDTAGIRRAGSAALSLGLGFMATTALAMLLFPTALVGLFLDPADPANAPVIPLALSFLFVAALFQIFDGAQVVAAGMLRGLHDTRVPMIYAGFGYWIIALAVAVVLAFVLDWRGIGIWTGLAVGLAVVAALMLQRWLRRERLGLTVWREAAS
jgi:MATE family multidrug resistance protein